MASVLIVEDSMLELYRYVNFLKELDHYHHSFYYS